ncbi:MULTISPECIES: acyl-CoA dehydrogenase [Rhodococcus]|uniref:Acyl-CoA dehydrogenase n=1 Tax=Rhodococcus oxybenzonivorans TaxID=1990687 RepID=A0AAE4V4F2_9NOCA|nr:MULTISPECIES: acyl-CoA dehydrogenase [Rhodococcus]MDV7243256.1 acyl-CoA dehydrogenase [Rhodococcus oxybenzonivorans]MDV7268195.1 acyl-CoA dehydrogenase [Rhodococcus oxybenzonivorans]MDV7276684.1 acyl-CoA dehydrogenase [Rhodococcus oxybenzonivorans]MDV7334485.1 acyl-CoA dehydrogenase [Rhodococcus oxybenzonivorans]MDV7344639.1 acyl-CoA dehydrogenase [Rhodococcus oxybenzonivorans]
MTMGLTEEERDLRDSVRGWAARTVTPDVLRQAAEAKTEQRPLFWNALAGLGVLGLHLPEEVGGAGCGLVELAVVAEELGRVLAPGPFLPTVVTSAVLNEGGHSGRLSGLADGSVLGAVSLQSGSLRISRHGDEVILDGESGYVLGGQVGDLFLLAARDGDTTVFVVLPREHLDVTDLPSHDVVRRNAVAAAHGIILSEDAVLSIDSRLVLDLAATLFAAEASGIADWAVATAADYAKARHQFGRPIGQFQGVKHRVARMLTLAEQARVCAWDAARAMSPDTDPAEASLAAAVAGATAPEAAFSVTKDCIQVLGGIGYTWEHDAHLYLRRAQSLRILLGSTASWRRRVARATLDGSRRVLGIELPPEADRIRTEVRAELAPAVGLAEQERKRYLAEKGYATPHLPAPWGRGAAAVEQLVIAEELRAAQVKPHDMIIGNWVVPTLIAHGNENQVQRFVPPSLRGDLVWCQLFSEPGAGSDLAGLNTKATKLDGGWVLQGQKVWTSMARDAHWGICLARTAPDAPKHKGLSYFLIDMKSSEGLDIRPLREITGEALFNEVFLDNVFVPDELLVGEPGDGWKLARTTLANERVSLSHDSALGSGGEALLTLAADLPGGIDDEQLTVLGKVLCDAQSGGLMGLRTTLRSIAGGQPGAESSVAKLLGVEHIQQVWEVAMDWAGPRALLGEQGRTSDTQMFLNAQCMSIAGGTTNVQLNIIGERLLGLPRDPEPGK